MTKTFKTFAALTLLITLGACASADHYNPTVPNNLFMCDNARQMTISIADMSNSAVIQFEGNTIALERIEANEGIAFTNNIYTLYYDADDNRAVLERESVPILTGCEG